MVARGRGAVVNVVGAGGKVASPIHMPGGAANAALMLVSVGMAADAALQGIDTAQVLERASYITGAILAMDGAVTPMI